MREFMEGGIREDRLIEAMARRLLRTGQDSAFAVEDMAKADRYVKKLTVYGIREIARFPLAGAGAVVVKIGMAES